MEVFISLVDVGLALIDSL